MTTAACSSAPWSQPVPAQKRCKPGDVLLSIDDHPIASDGNVELEGERVDMPEIVERKFKGDKVKLDMLRGKQPVTVTIELTTVWPYLIQGHSYDVRPRYVLYGGLLFQPLNLDLMQAYQPADLRVRHFFDFFVLEQIYLDHPEVVVLTNILPDPINTYLSPYRYGIVDEINGLKIRTLNDLAKTFSAMPVPERFVVKMVGEGPPLVLDPETSGVRPGTDQDPLQCSSGTKSGGATGRQLRPWLKRNPDMGKAFSLCSDLSARRRQPPRRPKRRPLCPARKPSNFP